MLPVYLELAVCVGMYSFFAVYLIPGSEEWHAIKRKQRHTPNKVSMLFLIVPAVGFLDEITKSWKLLCLILTQPPLFGSRMG